MLLVSSRRLDDIVTLLRQADGNLLRNRELTYYGNSLLRSRYDPGVV